ncbi:hypothetical protein MLD38_012781 [Melastoma candidum]|uniref:Uncharacterized protein n=1 Tax=Melastoma candidum TaxID=119954 RepID=A0ACB9R7I2_9MYRT|nr:hypothetical protein MLD38_012781 [Melastoma candidum]
MEHYELKVDVQNILETLGAGHGGRVRTAQKYHQVLEASISRNVPDNGIISCMESWHLVYTASDDFWPRDASSRNIHIASVALQQSSLVSSCGRIGTCSMESLHPMAKNHGAARAVGGCAIYQDFNLLRKLVLPDGSILSCLQIGQKKDKCRKLLESSNRVVSTVCASVLNWSFLSFPSACRRSGTHDFTSVIGVFNYRGAGWCTVGKKYIIPTNNRAPPQEPAEPTTSIICPSWPKADGPEMPLHIPLSNAWTFGCLLKMFNSSGAIKEQNYEAPKGTVTMIIRGCGLFGAYTHMLVQRGRWSIPHKQISSTRKRAGCSCLRCRRLQRL